MVLCEFNGSLWFPGNKVEPRVADGGIQLDGMSNEWRQGSVDSLIHSGEHCVQTSDPRQQDMHFLVVLVDSFLR